MTDSASYKTGRQFCATCMTCRTPTMRITCRPYSTGFVHDGRRYDLFLPNFFAPCCTTCSRVVLDDQAEQCVFSEFHIVAGLLMPEEITVQRVALGLPQPELARLLGVSHYAMSRWELGAVIQPRWADKFLRAFFAVPELRSVLTGMLVYNLPGKPIEDRP